MNQWSDEPMVQFPEGSTFACGKTRLLISAEQLSHRDDLRFWQTVSLSLALFALGLIASLVISLIVMLIAK